MTPKWKADVVAELERRDADPSQTDWYKRARAELAKRLDVDKSAITKLLKPGQTASAMVPRISKILGVPMPVHGTDEEIADLVAQLDDEGRAFAVEMLRRLVK